jgi:hypothetical protein
MGIGCLLSLERFTSGNSILRSEAMLRKNCIVIGVDAGYPVDWEA